MKRILIVEDEPAYLKLLHEQLVSHGYKVYDARDGVEGLRLAADKKPDLILLDLLMPKIGGLQMLDTLRRLKWGKTMPVFVLTNSNDSHDISESLNNRASKYIVKSDLKLEDLFEEIKLFL